ATDPRRRARRGWSHRPHDPRPLPVRRAARPGVLGARRGTRAVSATTRGRPRAVAVVRPPGQKLFGSTISPPPLVTSAASVLMLIDDLMNRTLPSAKSTLAPPGWKL